MADTAIVGRKVEVLQTNMGTGERGAFSWGSVVAGALAATAVTFILLALGAGIGFLGASPYSSGPSAKTLTVAGAIWIVLAQAWGYAVGGYFAGRLRSRFGGHSVDETNFRDGAHGFAAWALGVVLTITMVALGVAFGAGTAAHVGATLGSGVAAGGGAAAGGAMQGQSGDPAGYYVDTLFRTAPGGGGAPRAAASAPSGQPATAATGSASGQGMTGTGGAPAASPQGETPPAMQPQATAQTQNATPPQGQVSQRGATTQDRGEVGRLLVTGMRDGKLSDEDRAYLGRIVQDRTGLTSEEANRRVDETVARVNQAAKDAADKAAKATAYFSLWSFIALLFGAMAATVGGIVGGNQRDENLGEARF